jgi:hypothetical protein
MMIAVSRLELIPLLSAYAINQPRSLFHSAPGDRRVGENAPQSHRFIDVSTYHRQGGSLYRVAFVDAILSCVPVGRAKTAEIQHL